MAISKVNKIVLALVVIVAGFTTFFLFSFFVGFETESGYGHANAYYSPKDGHWVRISTNRHVMDLDIHIEKGSLPGVSRGQFSDVEVINLKTGELAGEKIASPLLNFKGQNITIYDEFVGGSHSTNDAWPENYDTAGWSLSENKNNIINGIQDYVDYQVNGVVTLFNDSGQVVSSDNFETYLMRDYKEAKSNINPDDFTSTLLIGPGDLFNESGSDIYKLTDWQVGGFSGSVYITYYGTIDIQNGELVFSEIDEKREVYSVETSEDEYEWIDDDLVRVWETKRIDEDPRDYEYESIYERRGYTDGR